MKIRNGFVSNSSSSSFIMGIAKLDSLDTLKEYIIKNGIDYNSFRIYTVKELKDSIGTNNWFYYVHEYGNGEIKVSTSSFIDSDVSINIDKYNDTDNIVIVNANCGGSDSDFMSDSYDMDYDIDLSYFDTYSKKLYTIFADEKSGINIPSVDRDYGAGRDG